MDKLISSELDFSSDGESELVNPEDLPKFYDKEILNMTVACTKCGESVDASLLQDVSQLKHECSK